MADDQARLEQMQAEFLERHKNADELVVGVNTGVCLGAVYFSPREKFLDRPLRTFFRPILDAMTISEEPR